MSTQNQSFIIADTLIHCDEQGRYCLNDLHKAAGGNPKDAPAQFFRNDKTIQLVEELKSDVQNCISPVNVIKGNFSDGITQGTFVVKELVYAYAMWVSARFHLTVIRAYDALVTGTLAANAETALYLEELKSHLSTQKLLVESQQDQIAYVKLKCDEAKSLRLTMSQSQNASDDDLRVSFSDSQNPDADLQISSKVRSLMLWTEKGAVRHAKILDTDKAWEVQERLEEVYFHPERNENDEEAKYFLKKYLAANKLYRVVKEHLDTQRLLIFPSFPRSGVGMQGWTLQRPVPPRWSVTGYVPTPERGNDTKIDKSALAGVDYPCTGKIQCREYHSADEKTAKRGTRFFCACRFVMTGWHGQPLGWPLWFFGGSGIPCQSVTQYHRWRSLKSKLGKKP